MGEEGEVRRLGEARAGGEATYLFPVSVFVSRVEPCFYPKWQVDTKMREKHYENAPRAFSIASLSWKTVGKILA